MNDLITRLEAATGPDRELDAAIAVAISGEPSARVVWRKGSRWFLRPGPGRYPLAGAFGKGCQLGLVFQSKRFTASIDAALALVPEGWGWRVEQVGNGPSRAIVGGSIPRPWLDCATPALAICIAALKARDA